LAVSEKTSALLTVDYLNERARKGDKNQFDQIMSKVPNVEAEAYDKL
tara:strand:- start:215 stop:355 length:141 start_codon:yes stop_codon:yes gene_type:complete